jgi:hypothetical protein
MENVSTKALSHSTKFGLSQCRISKDAMLANLGITAEKNITRRGRPLAGSFSVPKEISYLPMRIKIPAAIARIYNRKTPGPKFRPNPRRASRIKYKASKSMPMFLVSFIRRCCWFEAGMTTQNPDSKSFEVFDEVVLRGGFRTTLRNAGGLKPPLPGG